MMRTRFTIVAAGFICASAIASAAAEEPRTPVALELILAVDTSASVDAREFELQIKGISQAFAHPEVIAAIESLGAAGMAVTMVQWSIPGTSAMALPFHQVHDSRSAKAFGFLVGLSYRRGFSGSTAMGHAIDYCTYLLENNEFEGERRVIDVSGDGRNNAPPDVEPARDSAVKRGITINGLAINSDDPRLDIYYKRSLIGGPDAFVEVADDFSQFATAIRQKLIREIYPPLS
jgi:hypothetical protein